MIGSFELSSIVQEKFSDCISACAAGFDLDINMRHKKGLLISANLPIIILHNGIYDSAITCTLLLAATLTEGFRETALSKRIAVHT